MSAQSGSSRRGFLQMAGVAAGTLAASKWLHRPRRRLSPSTSAPPIKRVIVINAPGGVRWNATFDGQSDIKQNPWGVLNAAGAWTPKTSLGGALAALAPKAPSWGVSRMMVQRPLPMNTTGWPSIYAHLSSDDPSFYNLTCAPMPLWGGKSLSHFIQLASQIAVVRNTQNPGGQFDGDHADAQHTLVTGKRSGQVGLVTAMQHALKSALGSGFDAAYKLPAVSIGVSGWSLGVGPYAGSRPIFLSGATSLPTVDPGKSIAKWGRAAEVEADGEYQLSRQSYMGQAAADFENDKGAGDAHVGQLVDGALHLTAGAGALGTLLDGATPVTNDMLNQCFGVTSDATPTGDALFDVFAALQNVAPSAAKWTLAAPNSFGLNGALAVRLLQAGAPVVSCSVGAWDTHSYEVIDPLNRRSHPPQAVQLARMLCGLEFALKNIADPLDGKTPLWDSTVVFVCSEFGRGDSNVSTGFNTPDGANDGGSGHWPQAGWPVFGGPVAAAGQLLTAPGNGGFFAQSQLYVTLLKGMGADTVGASGQPYLGESDFSLIPGLIAGVK